jgi:hypothetical protein
MRSYPDWLHQELRNWARFCWEGEDPTPTLPHHCGSAEGEYLAPAYESLESDPNYIPADPNTARIVDRVFKQSLSHLQRLVLMAEYTQRVESGVATEGLRAGAKWVSIKVGYMVTQTEYQSQLFASIGRIWDAFEPKRNREAA